MHIGEVEVWPAAPSVKKYYKLIIKMNRKSAVSVDYIYLQEHVRSRLTTDLRIFTGFTAGSDACCGSGLDNGGIPQCGMGNYNLCKNVEQHAFWDFTHLTERAYHIIADIVWGGDSSVSYPINIRQLAGL